MKATPRLLIGRKIVAVDLNPFKARDSGPGMAHSPVITLDNGATLRFVTEETDFGEYGTNVVYAPRRAKR